MKGLLLSVIERDFSGDTVELDLPGKRVRVLRSNTATQVRVVGATVHWRSYERGGNRGLCISGGGTLRSYWDSFLSRLNPRINQNLVNEDERIGGYDFLVVLPPNITFIYHTRINGSSYSESYTD